MVLAWATDIFSRADWKVGLIFCRLAGKASWPLSKNWEKIHLKPKTIFLKNIVFIDWINREYRIHVFTKAIFSIFYILGVTELGENGWIVFLASNGLGGVLWKSNVSIYTTLPWSTHPTRVEQFTIWISEHQKATYTREHLLFQQLVSLYRLVWSNESSKGWIGLN